LNPNPHRRASRGFTLIEIMAVLVIIAGVMGVFAFSIAGRLEKQKISGAAREVMSALRMTRSQAIVGRQEQALEVDLDAHTVTVPGREPVQLPEQIELKLVTASTEVSSSKVGRIRFFPDGGSTGGSLSLMTDSRQWQVKVSWLTGEIELDDGLDEQRRR